MPTLLNALRTYKPFKALVVGDFMLDQHVYGAAERLSPDAPVPVLHATKTDDAPGGASNVSLCIRGLKGDVWCCGVVGHDKAADTLREKLAESGCDISGLLTDDSRPTTVKRSMVGLAQHRHPQKMFRVDYESNAPLSDTLRDKLLATIKSLLQSVDVVCLEDYNKGVCTPELCKELIAMCRSAGRELLVDPAAIEDYSKYSRATAVTPNRSEAELATGLDTPIDASELHNAGLATRLLKELDLDAVVLTLDKHGALLEERGKKSVHVPTVARSVYDVTGAGDMVLAALAAARANKIAWHDAVRFANVAAGLEVQV
ncbi:MAG TPA: bifunctional ADP-heptose synthase, partial [Phycisphaerales bacterium]|nr:bifunctional ADP-heptose synthase [Phycisphaerales bacterium]